MAAVAKPLYGSAFPHRMADLADLSAAPTVQVVEAGTAVATSGWWFSSDVNDITVTPFADMQETPGIDGFIGHVGLANEGVEITMTITPRATSKASAVLAAGALRKGTVIKVSNAPVMPVRGHEGVGTTLWDDPVNTGTLGTDCTAFVRSCVPKASTTGDSTMTLTYVRFAGFTGYQTAT